MAATLAELAAEKVAPKDAARLLACYALPQDIRQTLIQGIKRPIPQTYGQHPTDPEQIAQWRAGIVRGLNRIHEVADAARDLRDEFPSPDVQDVVDEVHNAGQLHRMELQMSQFALQRAEELSTIGDRVEAERIAAGHRIAMDSIRNIR